MFRCKSRISGDCFITQDAQSPFLFCCSREPLVLCPKEKSFFGHGLGEPNHRIRTPANSNARGHVAKPRPAWAALLRRRPGAEPQAWELLHAAALLPRRARSGVGVCAGGVLRVALRGLLLRGGEGVRSINPGCLKAPTSFLFDVIPRNQYFLV